MDSIKLSRFTLGLMAGCIVLMTAAYLLFLTATWNQLQVDRLRRDERIDDLLGRISSSKKTGQSGPEDILLSVRDTDDSKDTNFSKVRGQAHELLRPVREQATENAPAGD